MIGAFTLISLLGLQPIEWLREHLHKRIRIDFPVSNPNQPSKDCKSISRKVDSAKTLNRLDGGGGNAESTNRWNWGHSWNGSLVQRGWSVVQDNVRPRRIATHIETHRCSPILTCQRSSPERMIFLRIVHPPRQFVVNPVACEHPFEWTHLAVYWQWV